MDPITPIIHANGTGKYELLELRNFAYYKLDVALVALKKMAPNPRDYEDLDAAQEQHQRRMKAITDLMAELEAECRIIGEQS